MQLDSIKVDKETMMEVFYLICLVTLLLILIAMQIRHSIVTSFKLGYYKQKLKNRNIDTSHVDSIGFWEIIFK